MTTISADGLVLRRGGATLLAGLTLSLGPASSVAVIGPNGAGKSTLVNLLSGELKPSSGTISLREQDVTGWSADRIARL